MSICVNGHLLDADSHYCGKCGSEISERTSVSSEALERLAIRPPAELLAALLRLLNEAEPVEGMFVGVVPASTHPSCLLVLTPRRVVMVSNSGTNAEVRSRDELRGVAYTTVQDGGSTSGWVALLYEEAPYETFQGSPEDASHFASRCNDEIERNRGVTDWWDNLPLELWERFPQANLVVAPEQPQGKRSAAAVGIVATGIQIVVFRGRRDRDLCFVPWREIGSVTIDGIGKTSVLSIESGGGSYVFEIRDIVSSIRARLKPVLASVGGSNEDNQHRSDDPIAQISRLGELRDSGLITPAEFDESKSALLRRVTGPTGGSES